MAIEIAPIPAQQDARLCEIIQQVGAEYCAVGEGFGPPMRECSV